MAYVEEGSGIGVSLIGVPLGTRGGGIRLPETFRIS